MATAVYKDAYLSINATDLSAHVASLSLNQAVETPEDTAMGDDSRSYLPGLKTWSVDVEFRADFATSQVDATISGALGSAVAIEIRPTSGAASTSNPAYQGNGIITSYSPQSGSVGDVTPASVSITGTGDLTRATA